MSSLHFQVWSIQRDALAVRRRRGEARQVHHYGSYSIKTHEQLSVADPDEL